MERLLSTIRNKYIIAGVAFTIWMLFFDRHDVATQYSYYSQLKELRAEKSFYTTEIEKVTKSIHDLNSDPQALQRVAREKYKMKKENEDVFVIIEEEVEE
ncbi:septum formation initiator family protein [Parapedobacter sp. GCM10030251]|jgi:Septum formation initiator|uniref:FtsB family cell division protein n=1 Tax=Parapedobacter sp. GCM10030251 TaxID=3273419 RepID=UPI00360725A9